MIYLPIKAQNTRMWANAQRDGREEEETTGQKYYGLPYCIGRP